MGVSRSARSAARTASLATAFALLSAGISAQAAGVAPHPPANSGNSLSPSEYALAHSQAPLNSVSVLGNYYFFDPAHSDMGPALGSLVGGFRLSTGIVGLGHPANLFDTRPEATQNLPYFGLGYSHLWFTGQLSLNADFGLASQNAGGFGHLRGLFGGTQTLDEAASDPHWSPIMAVNVRYSF